MNELSSIRKEYLAGSLSGKNLEKDPFTLFRKWFQEAKKENPDYANAMVLSTNGSGGYPEGRVVLLKSMDKNGFSFYTNYNSRKAKSIEKSPLVSLTFFWPELQRQVRIMGTTKRVPEKESDEYFASRPLSSRLGAWASDQSTEIESRIELDNKFGYYAEKFQKSEVPRPPHWGGYIVKPEEIEFWQGRENRLHDRFRYRKSGETWEIKRLAP